MPRPKAHFSVLVKGEREWAAEVPVASKTMVLQRLPAWLGEDLDGNFASALLIPALTFSHRYEISGRITAVGSQFGMGRALTTPPPTP